MQSFKRVFIGVVAFLSVGMATAAPTTITLTGEIAYSNSITSYSTDLFGFPVGDNFLTGKSVVQRFIFDPDVPVHDFYAGTGRVDQAEFVRTDSSGKILPVWFNVSTTIDGVTLNEPPSAQDPDLPYLQSVDGVDILDRAGTAGETDVYIITQGTLQVVKNAQGKTAAASQSQIRIENYSNFVRGLTPNQVFSLDQQRNGYLGMGQVTRSLAYLANDATSYQTLSTGYFNYAIHSVEVSSVPEPGSMALLVAGLPLIWMVRRRQTS